VPDPLAAKPDAITIDRLILDIPGIDARQARTIAQELALRLGGIGIAGLHDGVTIEVDGDEDLPARIAAALGERLL
jgi:hypothetical protein